MRKRLIVMVPLAILGMVVFMALGGFIVQSLWNWLTPVLFGWHPVTFWQALGLLLLCRILFGGIRMSGTGGSRWRRRRMRRRFEAMTPEERERFRQKIRERWGCEPYADGEPG